MFIPAICCHCLEFLVTSKCSASLELVHGGEGIQLSQIHVAAGFLLQQMFSVWATWRSVRA
jgi:hypothetical protein